MENCILSIKKLNKSFKLKDKEVKVLDHITLTVNEGDIFGIIGLSGEGKSTLVRCINRLETPDSGRIDYYENGESIFVNNLNRKELQKYRKSVSMIFQDFNLFNQKTVFQNVEYPLQLETGYKRKEHVDEIRKMLDLVGLSDKLDSYPSQLSGGQKQRVAIARSLILHPRILLCDECTSALDPNTANSILDLLKKLNKELGLTVIIIAHQMSVIERICNKVAILSGHKIIEQGNVSEIFITPKTKIARSLIYSGHVNTRLHEKKMIKLMFNGDPDVPVITNIIQECNILVSIVYANSWVTYGEIYGQIIIKLPYYDEDIAKLKNYLTLKNIRFEEVSSL